jgi:SOS-response transcriptional repressor LexA
MLADWLRNVLRDKQISQVELARRLTEALGRTIDKAAVNKMTVPGKKGRKIAADELLAILEITGAPPPTLRLEDGTLLSGTSEVRPTIRPLIAVPIVGKVEAGVYREVLEYDDDEPENLFVERDPAFPKARVFGLEVVGDSMNDADPKMPPGSVAICVDFDDTGLPVSTGMNVVIERSRGDAREWSIKEVEFRDDETIYHPRSTNPRHKPIVVPHNADPDDESQVRIIGLVRSVVHKAAT